MTLQPAGVVAPDVELWATGALRAWLAGRGEWYAQGVYVGNRKPSSNRPRTVVVRRDGGSLRGVFDFPRLGVRVWADDEQDAADLSRLVQAWFVSVAAGDGVCVRVASLSGPSPVPDASQAQRYMTFEATMRCEPLGES